MKIIIIIVISFFNRENLYQKGLFFNNLHVQKIFSTFDQLLHFFCRKKLNCFSNCFSIEKQLETNQKRSCEKLKDIIFQATTFPNICFLKK